MSLTQEGIEALELLRVIADASRPVMRVQDSERLAGSTSQDRTPEMSGGQYLLIAGAAAIRFEIGTSPRATATSTLVAAYSQTPLELRQGERVAAVHEDTTTAYEAFLVPVSRRSGAS